VLIDLTHSRVLISLLVVLPKDVLLLITFQLHWARNYGLTGIEHVGETSDKICIQGLIFNSGGKNAEDTSRFVIRMAEKQRDLSAVVSWLIDDDEKGNSGLKPYTPQEIERYVDRGELFIADASTDSTAPPILLATTIINWLEKEERDDLINRIAPIPLNVANELPQDLMFVLGTKMKPTFIPLSGRIGRKRSMNLGASFLVETMLKSIRDKYHGQQQGPSFVICSGNSLGSLSSLHLHSKIGYCMDRHVSGPNLVRRIIQEHTLPDAPDDQFVMTYDVCKLGSKIMEKIDINDEEFITMRTVTDTMENGTKLSAFVKDLVQDYKMSFRVLPPSTLVHGKKRGALIDLVPETLEQANAVVVMASKQSISISALGRGKRWGATAEIPSMIRLNLKKLDKIPLLDTCNGLIVVEPGTTQGQVADALRGSGWYLPITGSCRHSSIVGNAIDGGITSEGLRIDQVVGVHAVEWGTGKTIKTGALAYGWHAAPNHTDPDATPSSFLFGKRAAVLELALSLKRLPKYVTVGVIPGSTNSIRTACSLYKDGILDWWQLRVEPGIGSVVVVKTKGMHKEMTKFGVKHFFEVLERDGQIVHFSTKQDIDDASVEGKSLFPDFFLKAGMDYFRGEPSCDTHHNVIGTNSCSEIPQDGNGFQLKAFTSPANPSIIILLRDKTLSAAALFKEEGLVPTITTTPMWSGGRYNTVYFLIWATFDREDGSIGDKFFASVDAIMRSAGCPPCRY